MIGPGFADGIAKSLVRLVILAAIGLALTMLGIGWLVIHVVKHLRWI